MKRNKIIDLTIIICILVIASFSIPTSWIDNFLFRNITEIVIKIIGIIIIYFYAKKNNLLEINFKINWSIKLLLLLPYLVIPFSNYFTLQNFEINDFIFINIFIEIIKNIFIVILEEFVFRIILFNNIKKDTKSLLKSIIISSLIFGAMHLLAISSLGSILPCIIQMIYTSLIGMVLCIIYCISESNILIIIFHLLFNIFNNVIITNFKTFDSTSLSFYIVNIVIGIIFAIYSILIYYFFLSNKNISNKEKDRNRA